MLTVSWRFSLKITTPLLALTCCVPVDPVLRVVCEVHLSLVYLKAFDVHKDILFGAKYNCWTHCEDCFVSSVPFVGDRLLKMFAF